MGRPPIQVPEGLRERLEAVEKYCLVKPDPPESDAANAKGTVSLTTRKGLAILLRDVENMSDSHYRDVLANKAALRPREIKAICTKYVGATPDMMTVPLLTEFKALLQKEIGAQKDWIKAKEYYEASRAKLAPYVKPYYINVDDTPDFPLIAKEGWLLERPFEVTPNLPGFSASEAELIGSSTASFHWNRQEVPLLRGTHISYSDIKGRDLGRRHFYDAPLYRLVGIEPRQGRPHQLRFDGGWYFDFINGLEVLGVELAALHRDCQKSGAGLSVFGDADLPMRGQPERALALADRPCATGLNTLLIVLHHTGHVFYMHKREAIGEAPNIWHIVPSGTFQPERLPSVEIGPDPMLNYSLWRTAFRELGEELLGVPEFEVWPLSRDSEINPPDSKEPEVTASAEFIQRIAGLASGRRPEAERLRQIQQEIERYTAGKGRLYQALAMTKQGKAKFFYLGCGLDPVSTKPELLCCLVLDLRDKQRFESVSNFEGKAHSISLSSDHLREWSEREDVLPAGQACLRLVADRHIKDIAAGFNVDIA